MNTISAAEIARIRASVEETMRDTCKLGVITETVDGAYTSTAIAWGSTIACGFQAITSQQGTAGGESGGAQTPTNDAVLRLPVSTAVTNTSRVKVYSKAGLTLSVPQEYAVVGAPQYGAAHVLLSLQAVTAGGRG